MAAPTDLLIGPSGGHKRRERGFAIEILAALIASDFHRTATPLFLGRGPVYRRPDVARLFVHSAVVQLMMGQSPRQTVWAVDPKRCTAPIPLRPRPIVVPMLVNLVAVVRIDIIGWRRHCAAHGLYHAAMHLLRVTPLRGPVRALVRLLSWGVLPDNGGGCLKNSRDQGAPGATALLILAAPPLLARRPRALPAHEVRGAVVRRGQPRRVGRVLDAVAALLVGAVAAVLHAIAESRRPHAATVVASVLDDVGMALLQRVVLARVGRFRVAAVAARGALRACLRERAEAGPIVQRQRRSAKAAARQSQQRANEGPKRGVHHWHILPPPPFPTRARCAMPRVST
mmetsp:Transcript_63609/g.207510  ORF Transcript_63609/g.207510 Transcript_63609/m.207510 type:complete len:342 (+) Transcript_63609:1558-2583(+)